MAISRKSVTARSRTASAERLKPLMALSQLP
jgi:hypothetical protein